MKSLSKTLKIKKKWIEKTRTTVKPNVPIALARLIINSEEISYEEGHILATQLDVTYHESEPTDNQQADEIFTVLAKQVIEQN